MASAWAKQCCLGQVTSPPCSHYSMPVKHLTQGKRRLWHVTTHATTSDTSSSWLQPGLPLNRPAMPTRKQLQELRQRPDADQARPSPGPSPAQPQLAAQQQHAPPSQQTHGSNTNGTAEATPTCILAVDYGTRWTGVALGKDGRTQELDVLKVDSNSRGQFARSLVELACKHAARGIVVGMPLDPYNPLSTLTNPKHDSQHGGRCRHLAHALVMLAQPQGIQVFLYDESGTSGDALRIAGYKGHTQLTGVRSTREKLDKKMDSLSAALLAKRFMDKPGTAVRVRVRNNA